MLDVGQLEVKALEEIPVCGLSDLRQFRFVTNEMHQTRESHEALVNIITSLPALVTLNCRRIELKGLLTCIIKLSPRYF